MRMVWVWVAAVGVALLSAAWRYQELPMVECAWCHRRAGLTVWLNRCHNIPQAAAPELRDCPTNLVVLCRPCHLCLNHGQNTRRYNPAMLTIVRTYGSNWVQSVVR